MWIGNKTWQCKNCLPMVVTNMDDHISCRVCNQWQCIVDDCHTHTQLQQDECRACNSEMGRSCHLVNQLGPREKALTDDELTEGPEGFMVPRPGNKQFCRNLLRAADARNCNEGPSAAPPHRQHVMCVTQL